MSRLTNYTLTCTVIQTNNTCTVKNKIICIYRTKWYFLFCIAAVMEIFRIAIYYNLSLSEYQNNVRSFIDFCLIFGQENVSCDMYEIFSNCSIMEMIVEIIINVPRLHSLQWFNGSMVIRFAIYLIFMNFTCDSLDRNKNVRHSSTGIRFETGLERDGESKPLILHSSLEKSFVLLHS